MVLWESRREARLLLTKLNGSEAVASRELA
jgi:hypothetical protein